MKLRQQGLRLLNAWGNQLSSPGFQTIPVPQNNQGLQANWKNFTTVQQDLNRYHGQKDIQYRGAVTFPGFINLEHHRKRVAITDQSGDYLYEDIYMRSWDLAKGILGLLDAHREEGGAPHRIAVLTDTGLAHIITSWACWMIGGVVVPVPVSASPHRMEHIVRHCGASIIIASISQSGKVHGISQDAGVKLITLDDSWWKGPEMAVDSISQLPNLFLDSSYFKEQTAMILYTSGRMGVPRGIALSHTSLATQINRVVDSWEISAEDTVLHCLSLHQVYSLVNALYAPLSQRARVLTVNTFQEEAVWSHLLGISSRNSTANASKPVTVFPATPSIYHKLILKAGELFKDKKSREYVKTTCTKKVRLMTSSESALPDSLLSQWALFTGHRILNNYVCTEVGTVLSNRLAGSTSQQGPTCFECGVPVDGIEIKLVRFRDETRSTYDTLTTLTSEKCGENEELIGELLLRGENTAQREVKEGLEEKLKLYDDGWFHTGDIVLHRAGVYRIKGKLGVKQAAVEGDGLEDVSLGEVEKQLLSSSDILDATVLALGAPHCEQRIAALLVITKSRKVTLENILEWCCANLQPHMVPTVLKIVERIPRDNYGRLDKLSIFNTFSDVPFICFQDTIL